MKMEELDVKHESFRQFLDRLRAEKELVDIRQPVDIRHIATLVDQSDTALLFHDVIGYDMPVVSGIIRSRKRAILSMGCGDYPEIEHRLQQGIDHPIPPKYVETARHKEIVETDGKVDLFRLPIPMSSIYDGGPMITAGVVIAKDAEFGLNSGMYRFMVKGTEPDRDRYRNAEQHAAVRAARLRGGTPLPDLDLHRHPSVRDHGLRFPRTARRG